MGNTTWLCYIQIHVIMRCVIEGLHCTWLDRRVWKIGDCDTWQALTCNALRYQNTTYNFGDGDGYMGVGKYILDQPDWGGKYILSCLIWDLLSADNTSRERVNSSSSSRSNQDCSRQQILQYHAFERELRFDKFHPYCLLEKCINMYIKYNNISNTLFPPFLFKVNFNYHQYTQNACQRGKPWMQSLK